MRLTILFTLFCFTSQLLFAQQLSVGRKMNWKNSKGQFSDYFEYIPEEEWAEVLIPVNLIFFTTSVKLADGTNGNFDPNNEAHAHFLKKYIEDTQRRYQSITDPKKSKCYAEPVDYIPDTKIRFDFKLYWIEDDYLWDAENACNKDNHFCPDWWNDTYRSRVDSQLQVNEIGDGIQVFFINQGSDYDELIIKRSTTERTFGTGDCSKFPSYTDNNHISYITMPNDFLQYRFTELKKEDIKQQRYIMSRSLTHEMGHSFNLTHQFDCHQNVMWNNGFPTDRNFWKPWQVGVMNQVVRHSHMKRFTKAKSLGTWYVEEDVVFDYDAAFYEHIEVLPGAKLELKGVFRLSPNSKIIVHPDASLVIDDATISTNSGEKWDGIVLKTAGRRNNLRTGKLTIKNSKISHVHTLVQYDKNFLFAARLKSSPNIEHLQISDTNKLIDANYRIKSKISWTDIQTQGLKSKDYSRFRLSCQECEL